MGINHLQISGDNYNKCQTIFELLNCNLLWIINPNNASLNIFFTDKCILEHYLNKKYYMYDPNASIRPYDNNNSRWNLMLGSDCETFQKSGFLYDLYKMFAIEEFATIEQKIGSELYCYRFFTRNNRFIFMNQLLNHMPLIKHFANSMTNSIKIDIYKQSCISMAS